MRQDSRPAPTEQYRVNHRIRIPRVRVIASDGTQIGILDTHEALRMAREEGLDLVEISPKAVPPVCKIMDYGRFKYETAKKEREERQKRTVIEVKEMKFRPKTDEHDFDFKVKHIREFLQDGNKAKLVIQFRGREIVHPEVGQSVLRRVVEACSDIGQVEQAPMMEGRRMLMIIGPKSGPSKPRPVAPASTPLPSTPPTGVSVPSLQTQVPLSAAPKPPEPVLASSAIGDKEKAVE